MMHNVKNKNSTHNFSFVGCYYLKNKAGDILYCSNCQQRAKPTLKKNKKEFPHKRSIVL